MTMNFAEALRLNRDEVRRQLFYCLSSETWVGAVLQHWPAQSLEKLRQHCDEATKDMQERDWLEAFGHHPRIGGDIDALRAKFDQNKTGTSSSSRPLDWSKQEQSGVMGASDTVLRELADLNQKYFEKFGFVFLICATGKGASEMLEALRMRISNSRETELKNAVEEQRKIMQLRLAKWIQN